MRVMRVLIANAEQATSRQQLFDAVWPNQTVSDDALTRCISDLRSQLKPLTDQTPLIDTIPKVGYRWLFPVSEASASQSIDSDRDQTAKLFHKTKLFVSAVLILIVMGWGLLTLIHWWSKPISVPLAILPTQAIENNGHQSAVGPANVSIKLKQAISQYQDLQYLSQMALDSHQGSPFPYFNHQFGVRWFIESQLSSQQDSTTLTLNLVDAKTALVTYSDQRTVNSDKEVELMCEEFMSFIVTL
jgi:DNA-binding winged helix-turn-helix (wHTH) protein